MTHKQFFLIIGPALFFILLFMGTPDWIPKPAYLVLISTIWIAIWWVTEAVPIPMASLLPMILYPLMGVMSMNEVVAPFAKPIIYLFIGGFILALAMEKWNLHRRIALTIIDKVGTNLEQILGGFIIATGFLSMWISNTATTMMMIPIAFSVIQQFDSLEDKKKDRIEGFGKALMMPVLAGLTVAINVHPYGLMVATCIAASCAFMLPFATAPNAIIFGSGLLEIKDMIRVGFLLNIFSIIVIVLFTYFLMPLLWGINLTEFPTWAR